MKISQLFIQATVLFFTCVLTTYSQSVVNTRHNLSVNGPGTITASSETEVCIFCHTPHNSSPRKPLWNRADPGVTYNLYGSSTLDAAPGQPDGASILCLSCHDGTIALGDVLSRGSPIAMQGGVTTMPSGHSNLSENISDDHPVSFVYNASLAATDGELSDPASLTGPVTLEKEKLQCTSCHDPHSDLNGDFLVAPTLNSELCMYCHQKTGWDMCAHRTSGANWNGAGNDPWFHTGFSSVSENACENCHKPHSAGGPERLTNYLPEENNCLDCHNGNVAVKDIQYDFEKSYRHNIYGYQQIHDPRENALADQRHVECQDCHNPHYANGVDASAPFAGGAVTGVLGIDSDGAAITSVHYEYEICYRCHADSPDKPAGPTSRQIEQNNVRLEFDPAGPSFHPVESAGNNSDVPSLIAPLSESSIIYCTDCHAGDAGTSVAAGPHGSVWPRILKYRYETADYTSESYQAYELCYQCHERNSIINSSTKFGEEVHRKHIVEEDTPCNICHDPHGISNSQGNSTNNSHLINFDIAVVGPSSGAMGRLEFIDNGSFSGSCYLYCHGKNHNPKSY